MSNADRVRKRHEADHPKVNYIAWIAISLVLALIISVPFLKRVRGFVVSSDYMEKGLKQGDWVFVKYNNDRMQFSAGDIVVFQYPPERSQYRFGRIIATGGQKVQVYKKEVYVNDIPITEPQTVYFSEPGLDNSLLSLRDYFGPFQVPPNSYFILGDNRDNSVDSRNWGELPEELIIGKPMFVYFSFKPDPNAPKIKKPPDVVKAFFYHVFHSLGRVEFGRIGKKVK